MDERTRELVDACNAAHNVTPPVAPEDDIFADIRKLQALEAVRAGRTEPPSEAETQVILARIQASAMLVSDILSRNHTLSAAQGAYGGLGATDGS